MLLGRIARQTDSGGKCIRSPLHPFVFWIAVSDDRSEGKTCGRVARRERPPSAPEFAGAVWFVGELAIKCELERQINCAGSTHSGKCGKSGISQVRPVFTTTYSIGQGRRSKFEAEADIGTEICGPLQRLGLNPVVSRPVNFCDEYSGSSQNGQFP